MVLNPYLILERSTLLAIQWLLLLVLRLQQMHLYFVRLLLGHFFLWPQGLYGLAVSCLG